MVIKHRRFIYRYGNCYRISIVSEGPSLYNAIESAYGADWPRKFPDTITAFEATFRYGGGFVAWIDPDWIETDTANAAL